MARHATVQALQAGAVEEREREREREHVRPVLAGAVEEEEYIKPVFSYRI